MYIALIAIYSFCLTVIFSVAPFGVGQTFTNVDAPVKIGLLVPADGSKDDVSMEAIDAANLAMHHINAKGGIKGRQFKVIIRACDGNWGAGSKQAVNLAFEEEVAAIVGSLDGRNAHLAEQVTTKAQLVFLSTRAADPSLAQINIPWFFRTIPDDNQQAELLTNEIYDKRKLKRILLIMTNDYDDNIAVKSLKRQIARSNHPAPFVVTLDKSNDAMHQATAKIRKIMPEGIICFGNGQILSKLLENLNRHDLQIPVFANLTATTGLAHTDVRQLSETYAFSGICQNKRKEAVDQFSQQFQAAYSYEPGITGMSCYDGITLLAQAMRHTGTDRHAIREYLSGMHYTDGLTEVIKFSKNGNVQQSIQLCDYNRP